MSINAFSDVAPSPDTASAEQLGAYADLPAGHCRHRIIAATGALARRSLGRRTRGLNERMPAARVAAARRWQETVADYLDQHDVSEERLRTVAWYVDTVAPSQPTSLRDVLDLLGGAAEV